MGKSFYLSVRLSTAKHNCGSDEIATLQSVCFGFQGDPNCRDLQGLKRAITGHRDGNVVFCKGP